MVRAAGRICPARETADARRPDRRDRALHPGPRPGQRAPHHAPAGGRRVDPLERSSMAVLVPERLRDTRPGAVPAPGAPRAHPRARPPNARARRLTSGLNARATGPAATGSLAISAEKRAFVAS